MSKFGGWSNPFRTPKHEAFTWGGKGLPYLDARPSWELMGLVQGPTVASIAEGYPCGPQTAYSDFHAAPNRFCGTSGVVGRVDPRYAWYPL